MEYFVVCLPASVILQPTQFLLLSVAAALWLLCRATHAAGQGSEAAGSMVKDAALCHLGFFLHLYIRLRGLSQPYFIVQDAGD